MNLDYQLAACRHTDLSAALPDSTSGCDWSSSPGRLGRSKTFFFCFLFARLEEAESKVRVLQLVSVTVEVLGDNAQAHLGAVASALPQVRAHACTCCLHASTYLVFCYNRS